MAPTSNTTPPKGTKKQSGKDPVKKDAKKKGKGGFLTPGGGGFLMNLLSIIVIFLLLMSSYSFIMSLTKQKQEIPLSQVAADVKSGLVTEITVAGNDLDLAYADGKR